MGSLSYLHQSSFVHGTKDEEGVRGPLHVHHLVQACVQVHDLKGVEITDHQAVLNTGGLQAQIKCGN